MKWLVIISSLLALSACTPAPVQYCQRQGLAPQTPAWGECMAWVQQTEPVFKRDRAECTAESSITYPDTLYDRGHYEYVHRVDRYGFPHRGRVFVGPEFGRNYEVDRLRARIINPCMQARGWNDPTTWEAGRVIPAPPKRRLR